ncbi:hypothetical protein ACU4GD_32885 [Cupriavidus basilensis]
MKLLAIERRSNTAGGHGFEPQEEGGLTALVEEVFGLRFAFTMRFSCLPRLCDYRGRAA